MHAICLMLMLLAATSAADTPRIAPLTRVRATADAAPLLARTAERSATVRDLLARLAQTDVIVYVEIVPLQTTPLARTRFVTATPSARFLRIALNSTITPRDAPALLAHELQHAVEIAAHAEVRDDDGVRRLYRRIGRQYRVDNYETDAARTIEYRVRGEMHAAEACREPEA
jgi:hypothetical protein